MARRRTQGWFWGFVPAGDAQRCVRCLEEEPRDATAEEEVPRGSSDLQPLRIFKTMSGDEGGGSKHHHVYVFRQDSSIRDHKRLLDHLFQPDLPYNAVRRVSLLVLY